MRNFRYILLSFLLLFSYSSYGVETKAPYAILMDYNTGELLFEKQADQKTTPSSMSKLMTIYVVFEKLKSGELTLDDEFIVSDNAWKKQGSKTFLHANSRVRLEDLIRGAIVHSGNDACITIAENISGTEAAFARLLNMTATRIGLTNSHFVNATGWPDEGHEMSMKDLAILSYRLIKDFPEYYHYFSEKEFKYNNIKQHNRNILLNKNIGVDGLKTGHTEAGGYGLASSAVKNGRRLIVVVNGLTSELERANEVEKILNYGFLNFANINLEETLKTSRSLPVWMGKSDSVELFASDNLEIVVPKKDLDNIKLYIKHAEKIIAPVKEGQKIAELELHIPGKDVRIIDLYAKESVEQLNMFSRFIYKTKNMLKL